MTREDIIRMAREAGIEFYPSPVNDVRFCLVNNLERFAALVADVAYKRGFEFAIEEMNARVRNEREECAKVCADIWEEDGTAYDCREAIKARGK